MFIFGHVHDPHPALTQFFYNSVMGNCLTDHAQTEEPRLEKGRKLETKRLRGKGAFWACFYIGGILIEKGGKFKGGAKTGR
jgi:hypothetical protein